MASLTNNGRKADEIYQAQILLYKHTHAYLDSMCLKWCLELGIPDIIHNNGQPITLHDLASVMQVAPSKIDGVKRLMRYLVHNKIFDIVRIHRNKEEDNEAYALTVASKLLVRGANPSLTPIVEYSLNPNFTSLCEHLKKWTTVENLNLYEIFCGTSFWDFLGKNSLHMDSFNEAMASDSQMINMALRDHKSIFEGLESVVDVGGGTGTTSKIITKMLPKLNCIVFDLPRVIENVSGSNNLSYVGGDMFKSIPETDGILLKWILHDWSDVECIKILEKCKDAISSKSKRGKIIIIDMVINEKQDEQELTELKLRWDILMTTCFNGKERGEEEWKKLLLNAGLTEYTISPFTGHLSLIEVYL